MMWTYWVLLGIMSIRRTVNDKNSASVSWAHAVNDKAFLKNCLRGDVDMLEADVLMGRLIGSDKETELAIMAHPPNEISDLSLMDFVTIVEEFNKLSPLMKGIKLDFKTIAAFESAITNEIFTSIISKANYPIWLNADILEGPLALPYSKPVDASRFLKGAKLFPKAVLSLGWTTGFNSTLKEGYSNSHVEEMLRTLDLNEVRQPVTFAVRAGLVAESHHQMNALLRHNSYTLTVWSALKDEGFDVAKLNQVLDGVGIHRIYIDVPDKLKSQLNLRKGENTTNIVDS